MYCNLFNFSPQIIYLYIYFEERQKNTFKLNAEGITKKLLPNICNMYFIYFYKPV